MNKYSEIRSGIKSGDIIATSNDEWDSIGDLQSQIVRVATRSEYSHVCVAWVVDGIPMVIEATPPLVRIKPLDNFGNFYWIPTPDKPMCDAELAFALEKVGVEGYSRFDAIAGQLELLEFGTNEFWQCAELTIVMRELSNLILDCKATPAEVVEAALARGYTLNLIIKD